jgi:hypothetical protein
MTDAERRMSDAERVFWAMTHYQMVDFEIVPTAYIKVAGSEAAGVALWNRAVERDPFLDMDALCAAIAALPPTSEWKERDFRDAQYA